MVPPSITVVGRGRRAARGPRVAGGAAAARPHGRGHPRPRAGERAGAAAARARRRGRRDAGDPHRAAARRRARPRPLRPRLPDEPERGRLLFERLGAAGRDARALPGATVAAIGPGTARALREHGVVADVVPERFVAEALVEALADVPVVARAGRPGARGPRRAARRAARAGRRGRRARALRDGRRAARRRSARRGPRGRLRHVHLLLDRALLPRGRRWRGRPLRRPASSRSGR